MRQPVSDVGKLGRQYQKAQHAVESFAAQVEYYSALKALYEEYAENLDAMGHVGSEARWARHAAAQCKEAIDSTLMALRVAEGVRDAVARPPGS